jgi:hypothetical protein
LGCSPSRSTPMRDDHVVEVLGVRHYSELAGQRSFDDATARRERDGARP